MSETSHDGTGATRPLVATSIDGGPVENLTGVRDVKSAARAVEVLELLANRQNRPSRLKELSQSLGVPKSSLYALLRTLVARGWVRTDPSGTLYTIGIRALLAGTSYLDTDVYVRIVQPHLEVTGLALDETIHFGRLDGTDIVYLATHESSQYLRPYSRVGRRLPAFSTSLGKALLAEREGDELDRHLPVPLTHITPHTITDRDQLLAELGEARASGYAVDREENTLGLHCFGLALRYAEPAQDALSCSIPLARLTPQRKAEILEALGDLRSKIERQAPRNLLDD